MALGPIPPELTPVKSWHCKEPSQGERASQPTNTVKSFEQPERTVADASTPECVQVGMNPLADTQPPEPLAPAHSTRPLTPPPASVTVGIVGRLNTPT